MGKAKFRPPSIVDSLTFPVFGLTWYGTPASPKNDGVSLTAYCGGGGSAKTGVGNKIVCDLIVQQSNNNNNYNNAAEEVTGSAATPTTPPSSTFEKRSIEISTGEALCFGIHAFRPHDDTLDMIRLVACVGDDILLYGIPIHCRDGESSDDNEGSGGGAILLAKTCVGKGYGANVATYTAMHNIQSNQLQHLIGVGCENGHVVILQIIQKTTIDNPNSTFELSKLTECTAGHTKAICAIQFHPRGQPHILSSAKDGSARVFNIQSGQEVGMMKCEVHNPNGPPPNTAASTTTPSSSTIKTKDPRMMKRPPQILVRGCAYGDLEGKTMYTIASGKRGPAYLTKWKTLVPLNNSSSSPGGGPPPVGAGNSGGGGNNDQLLNIRQEYRIQCSPVPISATSLSSDGTILAMGSVEGSIILYNLETQSIMKQFNEVHDLPVTCIASRPIPNVLMLPGELEGGVNFDAVSASADNRLGRWTMQKKSRIKPVKKSGGSGGVSRKRGPIETFVWQLVRIPLLIIVMLFILAIRDVLVVCREEFSFPAVLLDVGAAGHCLYREVLWADDSRPGVMFVPQ